MVFDTVISKSAVFFAIRFSIWSLTIQTFRKLGQRGSQNGPGVEPFLSGPRVLAYHYGILWDSIASSWDILSYDDPSGTEISEHEGPASNLFFFKGFYVNVG